MNMHACNSLSHSSTRRQERETHRDRKREGRNEATAADEFGAEENNDKDKVEEEELG